MSHKDDVIAGKQDAGGRDASTAGLVAAIHRLQKM